MVRDHVTNPAGIWLQAIFDTIQSFRFQHQYAQFEVHNAITLETCRNAKSTVIISAPDEKRCRPNGFPSLAEVLALVTFDSSPCIHRDLLNHRPPFQITKPAERAVVRTPRTFPSYLGVGGPCTLTLSPLLRTISRSITPSLVDHSASIGCPAIGYALTSLRGTR